MLQLNAPVPKTIMVYRENKSMVDTSFSNVVNSLTLVPQSVVDVHGKDVQITNKSCVRSHRHKLGNAPSVRLTSNRLCFQ